MHFLNFSIFLLMFFLCACSEAETATLEQPEFSLLRRADQGAPEAQFSLGVKYTTGQGVPQDHREAAKWYRLAAEQGLAEAQANLSARYAKGEGVPQDYKEVYAWFNISAAQGNKGAI